MTFNIGDRVRVAREWHDNDPHDDVLDGCEATIIQSFGDDVYPYMVTLIDGAAYPGRRFERWDRDGRGGILVQKVEHIDSEEKDMTTNINLNEVETLRGELTEVQNNLLLSEQNVTSLRGTVASLTTENNNVRGKFGSFKDDVVEALRDLAANGYITDERAFETADDLGLADLYHKPTEIEVRITIPADEVGDYLRAHGKSADDLSERDIENILTQNSSQIEFYVDSFETNEV